MVNRGWIHFEKRRADAAVAAEAVRDYIQRALGGAKAGVLAKRTVKGDAFSWPAAYALTAWQARVLEKARSKTNRARTTFQIDVLNDEFFAELVRLSRDENGPVEAVEALRDIGIAVVIEEHLSKTKLDGGAMLAADGCPVIGLTLRFDRLDNFWFTLLHECVHVWKHLSNPGDVFLDRLMDKDATEQVEKEANRMARDLLIPRSHWRSASVRQMPTRGGVLAFADEVGIHPAIVAGRIQRETENYGTFSDLVGQGEVRKLFADE
jgi:HTH-type transcriptional regulator / antitoxin HigA